MLWEKGKKKEKEKRTYKTTEKQRRSRNIEKPTLNKYCILVLKILVSIIYTFNVYN